MEIISNQDVQRDSTSIEFLKDYFQIYFVNRRNKHAQNSSKFSQFPAIFASAWCGEIQMWLIPMLYTKDRNSSDTYNVGLSDGNDSRNQYLQDKWYNLLVIDLELTFRNFSNIMYREALYTQIRMKGHWSLDGKGSITSSIQFSLTREPYVPMI